MKTFLIAACVLVLFQTAGIAQFKSQDEQTSASQLLVRPTPSIGNFLGLFNPDNFTMRHNLSYSYISSGGQGLSVASYTNSMFYKIADPLNVRADLTVQGTPMTPYQSALNGFFLSRAELNYRPWENMFIKVEYNRLPLNYLGYYNPWGPLSPLDRWGDQ